MENEDLSNIFNGERQNLLINIPDSFGIHNDYLKYFGKDEFEVAFRQIWHIFLNIYKDFRNEPERFGLRRKMSWDGNDKYIPFKFLFYLFISGIVENRVLTVDVDKFQKLNINENNTSSKLKNFHLFFERLSEHGFTFEGLQEFKIPKTMSSIEVSYPDNPDIIGVLKLMADKARKVKRDDHFNICHFKLFADDMNTANYGRGIENFVDWLNTDEEKNFAYAFDKTLRKKGFFAHLRTDGYSYYDKESTMKSKGAFTFRLEKLNVKKFEGEWSKALLSQLEKTKGIKYEEWSSSQKANIDKSLVLYLRIRNPEKCLEYLQQCPESVRDIFRGSDKGCSDRGGKCDMSLKYEFENAEYWRCGCCSSFFQCASPNIDDIPHYIKLVEMGYKK